MTNDGDPLHAEVDGDAAATIAATDGKGNGEEAAAGGKELGPRRSRARFDENVDAMREGTRLYLSNDFRGAEALFRRGMRGDPFGDGSTEGASGASADDDDDDDDGSDDDEMIGGDDIDLRGAFGLQYAIVGLLRGIASMEDDQLNECLARLWEADALAAEDVDWIGRKVVRGTCNLVAGVVECLRKRPVQGAFHMASSWRWLRSLRTEALTYDGVGREVVRSAALLALGAFALILSLLPDKLVKAASWTTGFEVERSAGLDMLSDCQREGGVYAPIAALGWVAFHLDTKAFLGEDLTDEELDECDNFLQWAAPQFPRSLFFGILEADLLATRQKLPEALAVIDRAMALPVLEDLRALKAMFSYKSAIYHLAALEWSAAAKAFETSQRIYKSAGRRSLGPSMALAAAHCYSIAGGDGSERDVERMMAEIKTYRAMDKSNWVQGDAEAFVVHAEYEARFGKGNGDGDSKEEDGGNEAEALHAWSLLHLATAMVIVMRCTLWMSPEQAERFESMLDAARYDRPDDAARAAMCIAQLHAHLGETEPGLARCAAGLDLVPQLTERSERFGTVPMLHLLEAQLRLAAGEVNRADAALRASRDATDKSMVLYYYLSFKGSQLRRLVQAQREASFVRLDLNAGDKVVLSIGLSRPRDVDANSSDSGSNASSSDTPSFTNDRDATVSVGWDWSVDERNVDFQARFLAKSGEEQLVVPTTRHEASSGHVDGRFTLPEGCDGGVLELTFSNSFSYLRGKVVTYRLSLPSHASVSKQVFERGSGSLDSF